MIKRNVIILAVGKSTIFTHLHTSVQNDCSI